MSKPEAPASECPKCGHNEAEVKDGWRICTNKHCWNERKPEAPASFDENSDISCPTCGELFTRKHLLYVLGIDTGVDS